MSGERARGARSQGTQRYLPCRNTTATPPRSPRCPRDGREGSATLLVALILRKSGQTTLAKLARTQCCLLEDAKAARIPSASCGEPLALVPRRRRRALDVKSNGSARRNPKRVDCTCGCQVRRRRHPVRVGEPRVVDRWLALLSKSANVSALTMYTLRAWMRGYLIWCARSHSSSPTSLSCRHAWRRWNLLLQRRRRCHQ